MMLQIAGRFLCNRWSVLLVACALAPLSLPADVIFSNLSGATPNYGTGPVGANLISTWPEGAESAEAFTPTGNFSMTDAEVFVKWYSDPFSDPNFNLFLYSDNSGVPGSEIKELGSDLTAPSSFTLLTVNSFAPIDLTEGTQYWLVMTPYDANSSPDWVGGGSITVPYTPSFNIGASWDTPFQFSAQFQIDGTPIAATPEPSTLSLASLGVLCLLIAGRRVVKGSWGQDSNHSST
jgi:hypothetical protein